jgi:hypothetical protein
MMLKVPNSVSCEELEFRLRIARLSHRASLLPGCMQTMTTLHGIKFLQIGSTLVEVSPPTIQDGYCSTNGK